MFRSAAAFSTIVARQIHAFDEASCFIERISYP
jgi:hypothetical protein